MTGGGKAGHVDADLRDDHLRGQVTDARYGPQLADRLAERVQVTVHLRVDLGHGGGKRVELAQVKTQQEAMPVCDPALQCGPYLLGRCLDAPLHQGEQRVRVAFTRDKRIQDGTAGKTHDLGQHGTELEVGVLQRLLYPLHVAGLFAHQLLAGA